MNHDNRSSPVWGFRFVIETLSGAPVHHDAIDRFMDEICELAPVSAGHGYRVRPRTGPRNRESRR